MLDLTNQTYGRLTVIKEVERVGNARRWLCRCECGKETIAYQGNLRKGHTKSCGCLIDDYAEQAREEYSLDITGQVYGRLTAIRKMDNRKRTSWLCKCECGEQVTVRLHNLRSGKTVSCGCQKLENVNATREKMNTEMRVDDVLVPTLTRRVSSANTTGVKGVSKIKTKSGATKYRASIKLKGKRIELGTHDNFEDAVKARKKGEELYHQPYIKALEDKQNDK